MYRKWSPIIIEEGTHTFVLQTGMARLQAASAMEHIPSDGAYEDHDDGDGMVMIKVLRLEKEEREK